MESTLMQPRRWLVSFGAPAPLLSMNQKASRTIREHEQLWRDAAYWGYCRSWPGVGPSGRALPPCIVRTLLPVTVERRRDPANFQATVKRIVDGIQNAGAWPDDTPEFVDQRNPTFRLDTGPHQLVHVTLEEM